MEIIDVAIIGGGPAGISCAIQLKRFGLNPLIIEQNKIGGLLRNANLIENYIGFPNGISGIELVRLFESQLSLNEVNILFDKVNDINFKNNLFEIFACETALFSKRLVIASGTIPKRLSFDSNKLFYEIADMPLLKEKTIAVIGAGDAAFDYALNLSGDNRIFVLNRSDKIKCIKSLLEKCERRENITYLSNINVLELKDKDDTLSLICEHGNITKDISVDYLLAAIGRSPALNFMNDDFKAQMDLLIESKYLFMIGDVKNNNHRQISISIGDGIKAAMEVFE